MIQLEQCAAEILSAHPYKIVISKPVLKTPVYKKINILLKKGYYQAEKYTETQVFHENLTPDQVLEGICQFLAGDFLQMNAWSDEAEFSLLLSRKGKISFKKKLLKESSSRPSRQMEHNRRKQYLLEEGTVIPPLVDMGIFTKEGKVAASMQDKFRQINRFVEIIDDAVKNWDQETLRIVDFGCGKSYLTFILYYYFTEVRKIQVEMIGLDLKEAVIRRCNEAAGRYGYDHLHFEMGDINGYKNENPADMVITLHACDTATDYALFHAICWKTPMIFSVPCCQHEINSRMKMKSLPLIERYGIIKERTAALVTDAIRGNLLEYCGYKTQIMEFVELENTPKNLLIRAIRQKPDGMKSRQDIRHREKCLEEVNQILQEFQAEPALYRLLKENGYMKEEA